MPPRIVLAALLCLSISIAPPATAQAKDHDAVTIGSFNVENFFDVFDDPYTGDEGADVKSRRDVETIAAAVAELDADVVVFQELENEYLLKAMIDEFLPQAGYAYVACQRTNSDRGINLGVISRLPITKLCSYRFRTLTHPDAPGRQWRFARDVMQIVVDAGEGRSITLFNVHLKSNRDGPGDPNSAMYRTAEAMMLKQIIREAVAADPDLLAVAAGDFNSNFERRPEQDRPWPAMAHLRQPEPDGTRLLTDVFDALSDEERVTIPGSGRYPPATFDYILATPAMAERYVEGSAEVIDDPELTGGSDHRPLKATFRLD